MQDVFFLCLTFFYPSWFNFHTSNYFSRVSEIDEYLADVHDIPISEHLSIDNELRNMLLKIDPSIPKYIFTASVRDHAERCLRALGIEDLFVDIIDGRLI